MNALRPGLPPLPDRIACLPVDERGYPVPWFVQWVDGKPDFRIVDGDKFTAAIRFERCWICGGGLGKFRAFLVGPMCTVNRISAEPPSHRDCAEFAVEACPFLANPEMRRREKGLPDGVRDAAGIMIERNPGVTALWITNGYRVFQPSHGQAGYLVEMGSPLEVVWYARGRAATRKEILDAFEAGLPALIEQAMKDDAERPLEGIDADRGPRAINQLGMKLTIAQALIPAETEPSPEIDLTPKVLEVETPVSDDYRQAVADANEMLP